MIEFKKTESPVVKDEVTAAAEYLDSEVKQILISAVAACAKAKPENPRQFISDYLLKND